MLRAEKQLAQEINTLMRQAEILDAQEDRRFGKGKLGSELPDELRHKQGRLAKIRLAEVDGAATLQQRTGPREGNQASAGGHSVAKNSASNRCSSARSRRDNTWGGLPQITTPSGTDLRTRVSAPATLP